MRQTREERQQTAETNQAAAERREAFRLAVAIIPQMANGPESARAMLLATYGHTPEARQFVQEVITEVARRKAQTAASDWRVWQGLEPERDREWEQRRWFLAMLPDQEFAALLGTLRGKLDSRLGPEQAVALPPAQRRPIELHRGFEQMVEELTQLRAELGDTPEKRLEWWCAQNRLPKGCLETKGQECKGLIVWEGQERRCPLAGSVGCRQWSRAQTQAPVTVQADPFAP